MDVEEEWKKFMIKNRKWDSKKGEWKFPKPNEYHMNVKNVWIRSEKGSHNSEKGGKGYWQNVFNGYEMGPQLYKYCQLCGKNLEEIRNAQYPNNPRNVVKFCSKSHMIEYSKRKKIREKFKADGILWSTFQGEKPVTRNMMRLNYVIEGKNPHEVSVKARKSKWAQI